MTARALNQFLAIEKGVKARTNRSVTNAYKALQKESLFSGLNRTYRPKDDDGDQLPADESNGRGQRSLCGFDRTLRHRRK